MKLEGSFCLPDMIAAKGTTDVISLILAALSPYFS